MVEEVLNHVVDGGTPRVGLAHRSVSHHDAQCIKLHHCIFLIQLLDLVARRVDLVAYGQYSLKVIEVGDISVSSDDLVQAIYSLSGVHQVLLLGLKLRRICVYTLIIYYQIQHARGNFISVNHALVHALKEHDLVGEVVELLQTNHELRDRQHNRYDDVGKRKQLERCHPAMVVFAVQGLTNHLLSALVAKYAEVVAILETLSHLVSEYLVFLFSQLLPNFLLEVIYIHQNIVDMPVEQPFYNNTLTLDILVFLFIYLQYVVVGVVLRIFVILLAVVLVEAVHKFIEVRLRRILSAPSHRILIERAQIGHRYNMIARLFVHVVMARIDHKAVIV